ncbi:hypothetical protein [Brevibacterium aurantiacum]|uniref:hypothetical protein n=1 Tax=Brevibacterium aurantiacum TaxID=273384 RepID=UPI000F631239|nr:hypothetical protein [Brevibacterium aurantiacum]MDN6378736.1 hypothetical protein [Brevibacterium aurantiacum]
MFEARVPVRRVTLAMIAVMVMIFGLSGCERSPDPNPSPDLSSRADEIGDVLSALPGVETVATYYRKDNSVQRLTYVAIMADGATDEKAIHVASTLNDEIGSEFDNFDRGLTVKQSGLTIALRTETAVESLKHLPSRLRALTSALGVGGVTWFDSWDDRYSEDILEIDSASGSPFDVITAVRDQFGSEEIQLRLDRGNDAQWSVTFPYSVQAQDKLESAVGTDLEKVMQRIEIDGDHLTNLTVAVDSGPDVVGRLEDIIDRADSGTSAPWSFNWSVGSSRSTDGNLLTGGHISVGSCDYAHDSAKEKEPSQFMTTEAIKAQTQLRDSYDTCP